MNIVLRSCLAAGLIVLLTACSSATPNAPQGVPTVATVPASTDTPAPTETAAPTDTVAEPATSTLAPVSTEQPTDLPPTATPAAQGAGTATACGDVRTLGPGGPQDTNALQIEDCFWQAYQVCSAATLTVTQAGVDAGVINHFSLVKNSNQCQINDQVIHYVIPRPTPAPVSATCSGLTQQQGGLLFKACGDQGDVFVPSP